MEWEIRNDIPIYAQIVDHVRLGIAAGKYLPGERLPSVRDLAIQAGVNPNTMQRALSELERIGLVYSQRTAGRFVTEDKAVINDVKAVMAEQTIRDFLDAMSRLGYMRGDILGLLEVKIKEERGNADF